MVYEETINYISETIGWMYFIAWSMSFYPQSWKNYRNKNVGGFSLEFALLNPSGFFFYAVYSVAGRVNSNLGTGTVSSSPCFLAQSFYITLLLFVVQIKNQDLVFALHAFALSSVQLAQIFIYDRGQQGEINRGWIVFLIGTYLAVFTVWSIEVFDHPLPNGVNTLLVTGYCKAAITFVKYLP